jgi:hypothetical protein
LECLPVVGKAGFTTSKLFPVPRLPASLHEACCDIPPQACAKISVKRREAEQPDRGSMLLRSEESCPNPQAALRFNKPASCCRSVAGGRARNFVIEVNALRNLAKRYARQFEFFLPKIQENLTTVGHQFAR